jgi:dTMP kinase
MALFITFEGIEGSGKTCQIKIINEFLNLRGYSTVLTREPGGSPIGDQIRKILLDPKNAGMDATTELYLYEASRREHVERVIRPALAAKKIVLCDRFTDATVAYQGYGRGIDLEIIHKMNSLATGGLSPNITILFDCPIEVGIGRAKNRIELEEKRARSKKTIEHQRQDRFENEAFEFHDRVRNGYLTLAETYPERIVVIDSQEDIDSIRQKIEDVILRYL